MAYYHHIDGIVSVYVTTALCVISRQTGRNIIAVQMPLMRIKVRKSANPPVVAVTYGALLKIQSIENYYDILGGHIKSATHIDESILNGFMDEVLHA